MLDQKSGQIRFSPTSTRQTYTAMGGFAAIFYSCPHVFIGRPLDTTTSTFYKLLKLLALPRGLEPLFSP
jgi:hypothetical protein